MLTISKIKIMILFLGIGYIVSVYSQEHNHSEIEIPSYQEIKKFYQPRLVNQLLKFYDILYNGDISEINSLMYDKDSYFNIPEFIKYKDQLTGGMKYEQMRKVIQKLEFYDDGSIWEIYAILNIAPNKNLYYKFSTDSAVKLIDIYLPDGRSLHSIIDKYQVEVTIFFSGIINTKEEKKYILIYEKPNMLSKVVIEPKPYRVFHYSPNLINGEWYSVTYFYDDYKSKEGYIHKRGVITYKDFPVWLKKKIIKQSC